MNKSNAMPHSVGAFLKGVGIADVKLDSNNHLLVYLDNGKVLDAGQVPASDDALDATSERPVQNKIITAELNRIVNTLLAEAVGNITALQQTKVDKISGKGLSTKDFTSAHEAKLNSLHNYDDTTLRAELTALSNRLTTLVGGNANEAINSFNEIIAFLNGVEDSDSLNGILAGIGTRIAAAEARITAVEVKQREIEGAIADYDAQIESLDGRVDAQHNEINLVKGNQQTASVQISTLQQRMNVAEDDIDSLAIKTATNAGSITALSNRLSKAEALTRKVEDGSVVVDNTLSEVKEDSPKPVSGEGIAKAIKGFATQQQLTELSGELANTLVELKGDGSFDINGKAGDWVYYNLPSFQKGGKYSISLQLYDAINTDLYWHVVADNDKIIIDTRQVAPNVLISEAQYEADEDYENVRIGVYSSASPRMRLMMSSNVYAVSTLQPIQDIVGYKAVNVKWNTDYFISLDGYVTAGSGYRFSNPIPLKKGDTIKYSTKSYLFTAISLTDANSSYILPVVKVETGDVYAYQSFFYTAEEDCYIILSGLEPQLLYVDNSSIFLQKCDSLNKTLGESINGVESEVNTLREGIPFFKTPYTILRNTAVGASPYGSLVSVSMYDSLVVTAKGKKVNILFPLDYTGGYALYNGEPSSDTIIGRYVEQSSSKEWEIELSDDVRKVVLCIYKNEGTEVDFINTSCIVTNFDAEAGNDNSSQNYCGINIVEPFRILTGQTEWLYKDSLLAAFSPLTNFSITTDVDGSNKEFIDYSSKAFRLNKTSEGVFPLVVKATDGALRTTEKKFNVIVRNTPSKKLTNKDKLRVIFVGDSLIFANCNLTGREWLRMLNTDDTTTTESEDGSIKLPTLNLTDGKIQLFGEQSVYEEAPYTMAGSAITICQGTDSSNPFYNSSSSQPNELGEDGINKRVDFGWWFDKVIGEGEYPDLIYLATGPNDFVHYGWSEVGIEPTVKRVVAICKKIKAVCDSRAGGNSGLVIKVVQHQPYPVQGNPVYNFPPLAQRVLWQKTIVRYAEEFITQGMSSYAEVVPCASRFDAEVGYTLTPQNNNARYKGVSDELYTPEAIHMNSIGAYNYADALITDFIADERFD